MLGCVLWVWVRVPDACTGAIADRVLTGPAIAPLSKLSSKCSLLPPLSSAKPLNVPILTFPSSLLLSVCLLPLAGMAGAAVA